MSKTCTLSIQYVLVHVADSPLLSVSPIISYPILITVLSPASDAGPFADWPAMSYIKLTF